MLEILYRDEELIAVNKPHGLLVHRSSIAADTAEFALQMLRNQIQQAVYPAHRLDRKTGGVLLFSLNKEMDSLAQNLFADRNIDKTYLAVVRGYMDDSGSIDYPLRKENGTLQEALTHFKTLARAEVDMPLGKFDTSRYSLVEAIPETGRMHQIRKHFAHVFHPILADRPHGCNKQNKMWKDRFDMDTMLLHAQKLSFSHPRTQQKIEIEAPLHNEFRRVLNLLNLQA
ncbi:pseudouridine synthase [Sphingobacterium deserti]|uniref:tRNA pseudouridine synthase C n=1 Tax=Sphingobacterium deserti TaxID=1229276 RepID=A0A0B8T1U9_9SPHI|nr:pseudouridine synthase [Sphingobacterium deserti]KGE14706.1 tRNA pseudouridine synthase C [Sphingobacterium deserti]